MSAEQLAEAQARVAAAGLADRVTLLFCDYRDVLPRFGAAAFDAVVSCEMIEAVGHEHLPTYFQAVGDCLKPGGRFAMQVRAPLARVLLGVRSALCGLWRGMTYIVAGRPCPSRCLRALPHAHFATAE